MRRIWQIATKELLHNRRDGLAALFTIVLPVVFTVFLGLILGGGATTTLPLAIADSDGSAASQQLIQRLEDSDLLKAKDSDLADLEKDVKDQKVAAGLIIPAGYGSALDDRNSRDSTILTLVRIETSSGAQSVQETVSAIVAELNAGRLATKTAAEAVAQATGQSPDALLLQAAGIADTQLAEPAIAVTIIDSGSTDTNAPAQGFDQSSTGGLVNWVLFGIMGIAGMTVWERRQGLLRRLEVAGIRAHQIVGGKIVAMIIITLLQQILLVLVGRFALGVDYFSNPLALLLIMVSMSGLAASVGLLISVLYRSEQAVVATTVITALLLAAMGGAWFPLEVTGAGFSRAAHVIPSAWIMDSLHGITIRGWGVADVLLPLGVVWAWIVALFGLGVWRYRPE